MKRLCVICPEIRLAEQHARHRGERLRLSKGRLVNLNLFSWYRSRILLVIELAADKVAVLEPHVLVLMNQRLES